MGRIVASHYGRNHCQRSLCRRQAGVFGDNLYMYGPVSGLIIDDLPYAATTCKGRVRAQIATTLMEAHASSKVRATIGRGSDFYGPHALFTAVGERVFRPALTGKAASVFGNPDMPHTYTSIEDFDGGLVMLGEHFEELFIVDHSKFEQVFGANPTPHREAIRRTLGWFRQHIDRS